MRRSGFTILELLVVIGILAMLMALTLGGMAAMTRTDRLMATEHLVGDVIRQARHTARTSGAPVIVSITTDAQDRGVVSGISRVPIWTEGFDGGTGGTLGNITGVAGQGYLIALPTAPPPTHVLFAGAGAAGAQGSRGMKIVRGGKADGFYLTCQVRPPLAAVGSGQMIIPLVVVGPDDSDVTSLCGLMLRHTVRQEQVLEPGPFTPTQPQQEDISPFPGQMPTLATWELIGWISDPALAPDTAVTVSSIATADRPADVVRDEPILHESVAAAGEDGLDIAWPMAGGRWEEVGLLYDSVGRRLVLYRNGVRVGEKALAAVPALPDGDEIITVGSIDLGGGPRYADNAIIDEVGVHRLATAEPRRLPGDIKPAQTYQIVAHPDGRVEGSTALTFSGSFSQGGSAHLEVSIDGRVSGKITP